jgi:hypothetical protein
LASNIKKDKDIPQSLKEMMMTLSRKQLVAVEDTPYYPIVSRCVRRSYLCGIDAHSGKPKFLSWKKHSTIKRLN